MGPISIGLDVRRALAEQGFAWAPRAAWSLSPDMEAHWQRLAADWDDLELDRYLEVQAKFRLRRYGRYYWAPASDTLAPLPYEPYFQPEEENPYAGGIRREFASLLPGTVANPFLLGLVRATFACLPLDTARQGRTWEVRVHQIRIVAFPEQLSHPAPEGIHQDGTDFLTLHMVRRRNIAGGLSTIYDLERQPIQSFTMVEPLDSMILEDPRVFHGVTPVLAADGQYLGTRDLLGLDFIFSPDLQGPSALS
jgi:hypothetical protein